MFNLENKITWKELAPSLQAMFKTLQSQITDVKNEVNNINISLGDINDHLTQIDNSITNIEGDITNINNDISEINNNIEEVTNITNNITGMFATGEQGQVVKIDAENNGLFADDNFHKITLVLDENELNDVLKNNNPSLSMENIFINWRIIIHADTDAAAYNDYSDQMWYNDHVKFSLQNEEINNYLDKTLHANGAETFQDWYNVFYRKTDFWQYNSSLNQIFCSKNYSLYSAFVQDTIQTKEKYYLELYVNSRSDNDHFTIIFGLNKDSSGKEHTLSFIKASGRITGYGGGGNIDTYYGTGSDHVDCRVWSAIVYDFMNPTQKILFDNSASIGVCEYVDNDTFNSNLPLYNNYECFLGFRRNSRNSFNIESSKWSYQNISSREDPEFYEPYTLNVTFPTSKPDDWDQTMWNNIQLILDSNIIGLGVRSTTTSFTIKKQQGVFPVTDELYYLPTGEYYKWDYNLRKFNIVYNNNYDRSFLYDDYNNRLYFYYYKGNYVQIKGGYST